MADTWGAQTLNIQEYEQPNIDILKNEITKIPVIGNMYNSNLLTLNRTRDRRTCKAWDTPENIVILNADYIAMQERALSFHDGTIIANAIIENFEYEGKKGVSELWYNITFLEV